MNWVVIVYVAGFVMALPFGLKAVAREFRGSLSSGYERLDGFDVAAAAWLILMYAMGWPLVMAWSAVAGRFRRLLEKRMDDEEDGV